MLFSHDIGDDKEVKKITIQPEQFLVFPSSTNKRNKSDKRNKSVKKSSLSNEPKKMRSTKKTSSSSSSLTPLDHLEEIRKGSSTTNLENSIEFLSELRKNSNGSENLVSMTIPDELLTPMTSSSSSFRILNSDSKIKPIMTPPKHENMSSIEEINLPLPKEMYQSPKYGCLKGTRNLWKRKTQKNTTLSGNTSAAATTTTTTTNSLLEKNRSPKGDLIEKNTWVKKISRRTHNVGKNEISNSVSVLVSSKQMRQSIMEKIHQLKMKHISELKKYLFHHGFIKIGTSAPDDLLRVIYENCHLICGEIDNHNPDNLLLNYLLSNDDNFR
jgi:hypothetical protein